MDINSLITRFEECFDEIPEYYAAAPGRTELGGNHTDHQHGRVLAAAVNMVTEAVIAKNNRDEISVQSEGYPKVTIKLNDLLPKVKEQGTTAALIRGVAARFVQKGVAIGGFDVYAVSTVGKALCQSVQCGRGPGKEKVQWEWWAKFLRYMWQSPFVFPLCSVSCPPAGLMPPRFHQLGRSRRPGERCCPDGRWVGLHCSLRGAGRPLNSTGGTDFPLPGKRSTEMTGCRSPGASCLSSYTSVTSAMN